VGGVREVSDLAMTTSQAGHGNDLLDVHQAVELSLLERLDGLAMLVQAKEGLAQYHERLPAKVHDLVLLDHSERCSDSLGRAGWLVLTYLLACLLDIVAELVGEVVGDARHQVVDADAKPARKVLGGVTGRLAVASLNLADEARAALRSR
jgi:hypothetical protein